jgi:hypothetical protein
MRSNSRNIQGDFSLAREAVVPAKLLGRAKVQAFDWLNLSPASRR